MRAILLAAGQGTRLRPLTNDKPKCMVEYQGTPLLGHILRAMDSVGIDDRVIVTGYRADKISYPFSDTFHNDKFEETNMVHTLFCAENAFESDIIISYTDIIYRPRVLRAVLDNTDDFGVVVDRNWRSLWEERMDDPLQDAETLKVEDGKIIELGKKPSSYEEIEGQYIGLIKISGQTLPAIKEFYHSLDTHADYDGKDFYNMYMTSFIQLVIDTLMPVHPIWIEGGWMEFDAVTDLNYELCLD